MGYASYLEDIRDRLMESLESISKDLVKIEEHVESDRRTFAPKDQIAALRAIHAKCNGLLGEVNALLGIATEPDLEMAYEIKRLRFEVNVSDDKGKIFQDEKVRRVAAEKRVAELEDEINKRNSKKHFKKGTHPK